MKRVAIVVEGDTEEEFVKQVLAPHLVAHGVAAEATKPRGQGGNISLDRLAPVMASLSWSKFDAVTSLVDLYGFKRKLDGESAADLEARIDARVRQRNPQRPDTVLQFAYVQQYEFEALLFSDPKAFNVIPGLPSDAQRALEQVARQFAPEDINDDPNTAPSKRIERIVPSFRKRLHGPAIAKEIGLDAIRAACPRFDAWTSRLESL